MTTDFFSDNQNDIWPEIQTEVSQSSVNRFVASSEFFSSLVKGRDIWELREKLLNIFDYVEIIVYLREQSGFLRSLWAQSVKGPTRACHSFPEFLADLEEKRYFWDYSLFLRDWQNAFGRDSITACVFDSRAFYRGDLTADFCHKIRERGIEALVRRLGAIANRRKSLNRAAKIAAPTKDNASPSFAELEEIRQRNIKERKCEPGRASTYLQPTTILAFHEYEKFVIQLVSEGNTWVNDNVLSSQKIKLPVSGN